VVMILRSHKEMNLHTNINAKNIYKTSRMIASLMNMPVQANKAIVGRNAFAHSSGIHQDGVLKHRENYEIIDPVEVGISESSIVLTARSGRAALKHRLELLGIKLTKAKLDKVYEDFLALADKKKDIKEDDLLVLVGEIGMGERRIKLDFLQVVTGKNLVPMATVRLDIAGEKFSATESGNGPVNAAIKAVRSIIHRKVVMQEFLIQAMNKGSDDIGKVHMLVECNDVIYNGFGANTDIILASVEAFIDAINKIGNAEIAVEKEE